MALCTLGITQPGCAEFEVHTMHESTVYVSSLQLGALQVLYSGSSPAHTLEFADVSTPLFFPLPIV